MLERRCLARALRLGPPRFKVDVTVVDTCTVNAGQNLLRGTLWLPSGRHAQGPFPAVVIRSPYGAQSKHADWGNIVLAERGYAVLLQDTRGRFGSDGTFVPVEHEREDGKDTVRWVRAQPWCDGRVAVFGPSYLGLTAWACVGACEPGEIQAHVPVITQAVVRSAVFSKGGAIALELLVLWFYLIEVITHRNPLRLGLALYRDWRDHRLSKAAMHEPLGELDTLLFGRTWDFFQGGVREPFSDDGPFWSARSTLCELRAEHPGCVVPPPTHMVTGWHDFFARQSLQDFERAAALQPDCRLTVMPYEHWGFARLYGLQLSYRSLLQCMAAHMPVQDDPPARRAAERASRLQPSNDLLPLEWLGRGRSAEALARPVQLCFLGSHVWRGLDCWPPPPTQNLQLWLSARSTLRTAAPEQRRVAAFPVGEGEAESQRPLRTPGTAGSRTPACSSFKTLTYRYSPLHPTPACGGPSFHPFNSGAIDQSAIERRDDVLVFTSEQMHAPLGFAGNPSLKLRVWTSSRSIDILGRLCLVTPHGASINLCEGLTRVDATASEACIGDEQGGIGRLVVVELGPVAVELARGECLRLHVCSAAHPRWMRNLCSSPEVPLARQTSGGLAECSVCVSVDDEESMLVLPIVDLAEVN